MTDIIAAIDQATGCQQCGNPLGPSPSDDFCGEGCQHAWHARRASSPVLAPAARMPRGPETSVEALYVGGPLHNTRESVPLVNGRPPMDRFCVAPPESIDASVPSADDVLRTFRTGRYWFKGTTSIGAFYEWRGWE